VARTIGEQIRSELSLTASAGVAPNKFLAKIASDWKKPDGLFVSESVEQWQLAISSGKMLYDFKTSARATANHVWRIGEDR